MMRHFAAILGFSALAAVSAAQQSDAPLSDTKRQLQLLQKDKAAEKAGSSASTSGLQNAVGNLEAPALLSLPTMPSANPKDERDGKKKAEESRNWLLDGYDKLKRRQDGTLETKPGDTDATGEEKPLDPSDPDYFLLVYEKQRAETIQRRQEAASRETRAESSSTPDAFAPFMQEWLAGSPVREALSDSMGGRSESSTSSSAGLVASGDRAVQVSAPRETRGGGESSALNFASTDRGAGPSATNPFVQALGLPAAPDARSLEFQSPTAASLPGNSPSTLPSMIPAPLENTPSDNRRAPPQPLEDSKKYFPQLKKF